MLQFYCTLNVIVTIEAYLDKKVSSVTNIQTHTLLMENCRSSTNEFWIIFAV